MATHIKTNGDTWENYPIDTLKDLQVAVGGYIEIVYLPHDNDMILVVNEEGLIHNLPFNAKASDIAQRPILGDALYMTRREMR